MRITQTVNGSKEMNCMIASCSPLNRDGRPALLSGAAPKGLRGRPWEPV